MSTKNTDELWLRRACEPHRMHLLHAIADCADDEGRSFPSINYLAWKSNIPRRTVIQYLKEFRESGILEDGGRRSDVERNVLAFSERDTKITILRLDRLPLKKEWRKRIENASAATALGGCSGAHEVVQKLQGVVQPRAGGSAVERSAIRKNRKEPSYEPSIEPSGGTDEQNLPPETLARIVLTGAEDFDEWHRAHETDPEGQDFRDRESIIRDGKDHGRDTRTIVCELLDCELTSGDLRRKYGKNPPKTFFTDEDRRRQAQRARERLEFIAAMKSA